MKTTAASPPIQCRDFDDVIHALGGVSAVARIVGCGPSAVCNWRTGSGRFRTGSGRFPPDHYAVISMALYERGFFAPWALFRFTGIPPAEEEKAA
jgi:hypothetical protein